MRKSWSAKGNSTRLGLSKSTRVLLTKDPPSTGKLRNLLVSESNNSLTRPITAGSFWATSRSYVQLPPEIEIEGLKREDIKRIYTAKCKDLDISYIKDQEHRFFNFCNKSFSKRIIGLNENGLGLESIKVLSSILKKNIHFCRLNLSKNNIGESGAIHLGNGLEKNKNIISIDISSNDINSEGCAKFFDSIRHNQALININICSLEGLHRNRLGVKGAEAVSELLRVNRILTHLNIGDTGIGKEGLEYITQGIAHNNVLVSLDISNNGFSFYGLEDFCKILSTTKLKELYLSGNKIGNKGCDVLSKMLNAKLENPSTISKLDISMCDISLNGVARLCESLENNPTLTYLNLDNNSFGQLAGIYIGKCFALNGSLQHFSLNSCNLRDESVIKLCEGLGKNLGIKRLNLCKNYISDNAVSYISQVFLKNTSLVTLDLSYNYIKNKGGIMIANALRKNSTIENIFLTENSLKDESGRLLAEITRFKNNLLKIELGMNPINLKYIKEIKDNLNRNNFNYKQLLSPRIKKEIEKLTVTDNDIESIFLKIKDKTKEKLDYEEKITKQQEKLNNAIIDESEKYKIIMIELNEFKSQSQALSKELENILFELNRLKITSEKQVKEGSEQIAYTMQDIKKLEKQSK